MRKDYPIGHHFSTLEKEKEILKLIPKDMLVSINMVEENYRNAELNQDAYVNLDRVFNIVYKFVDFIVFVFVEVIKWSLEFGYTHAEIISFQAFLTLFYWLVVIAIVGLLVPLVIPFIAIIYLSAVGLRELYKKFNKRK